ncbi:MAG: AsmA family protein [Acetobacteraceae bacterium]
MPLHDVTRLRIALIALAGLAALLLLAVWQVPQWLDWTRYRTTIEVLASATLGQQVTLRGPISLTLLPQPVLTAAQVTVGGTGSGDLSISVEALRVRVALLPLIGGRVDARELVLRGAELRIPWPAEVGVLHPHPPAWLSSFAARIENGRLTIGRLAFTGVDATLATLDTGALSASGTGQFSGQDWHFTARLTAAGPDGSAGLNLTLDGQGKASGLGAAFTGQLADDGALSGTVSARGPSLGVLLPMPAVPFRADGRLTVAGGLAALDDLALEIGGSPASGAVALRVAPNPRLDIALSASRLNLDAWLPVLLRAGTTIAGIDVPIGIDFSAEAAPLGGGTLEHVRAAFDLAGKDLIVREATALLPGNGRLRLAGRIGRDDPARPVFEGDARVEAPVLRTTLRWLDEAMPGSLPPRLLANLPAEVAQRGDLSAHVVAGGGAVALRNLSGTLDDSPLTGTIGFRRGEPPVFTADLSLGAVALDPWLPSRPASLVGLLRPVAGLDMELRLSARRATLAGAVIEGLVVDAAVEAGNILLRRAEGSLLGAQITVSGALADGGRLSGAKLTLTTKDAAPLADLLPAAWRGMPALWHGPATLEMQGAGPNDALALGIRLALADARLEASPTIDLRSGEWRTTLTLRHPGARRLVAMLVARDQEVFAWLPGWLGDGSLSLVAHLVGGPGRIAAESFDLTAATLRATGDLSLDRNGAEPRLAGRIDVDTAMLPLPDGGSAAPLPVRLIQGWRGDFQLGVGRLTLRPGVDLRDAVAVLAVTNGTLRLDPFTARLGSGGVTGSLAFESAATPPTLAVQAKVSNAIIVGPLTDGVADLASGRADAGIAGQCERLQPVGRARDDGRPRQPGGVGWGGVGFRPVPATPGARRSRSPHGRGRRTGSPWRRGLQFRAAGTQRRHRPWGSAPGDRDTDRARGRGRRDRWHEPRHADPRPPTGHSRRGTAPAGNRAAPDGVARSAPPHAGTGGARALDGRTGALTARSVDGSALTAGRLTAAPGHLDSRRRIGNASNEPSTRVRHAVRFRQHTDREHLQVAGVDRGATPDRLGDHPGCGRHGERRAVLVLQCRVR